MPVPAVPPAPQYYGYGYYEYPPAPRVYRHYRYEPDDDGDLVVVPRARSGCGPYRYWDGVRCVWNRW
jgi:hypothetical protein